MKLLTLPQIVEYNPLIWSFIGREIDEPSDYQRSILPIDEFINKNWPNLVDGRPTVAIGEAICNAMEHGNRNDLTRSLRLC